MKLKATLLILLGMALSGQLLAPMAMAGCAGIDAPMHSGDAYMRMAMAEHTGHAAYDSSNKALNDDCCHTGHSGQCPMASCLTAALPGPLLIDSLRSRPVAAAEYLPQAHPQHTATHYRPPIFA